MYDGDGLIEPVRFNEFATMKEQLLADQIEPTFMIAPMAMKLREQGHKFRIVYLGHRDGTTLMVHKDSEIARFEGADAAATLDGRLRLLQGKKVAIPNRLSNQYLILFKAFHERGLDMS